MELDPCLNDFNFSNLILTREHTNLLEKCLNKKFGQLLKVYNDVDMNGARIIISSNGFTILFPKKIYYDFDYQVNKYLTGIESSCWACDESYMFLKILIDEESLNENNKNYMNPDINIRLDTIKKFYMNNFIKNKHAYPDSDHYSIGNPIENPQSAIPLRIRFTGNFKIIF
jgi:hypothetical protein